MIGLLIATGTFNYSQVVNKRRLLKLIISTRKPNDQSSLEYVSLTLVFSGVISMMLKKAREKYGTTADDVPQSSGRSPPEQSRDWECSICTSSNQTKVSLGCGHVMCDHCAIRSIENQQKCPFCQRSASEEDIRRIF